MHQNAVILSLEKSDLNAHVMHLPVTNTIVYNFPR